MKNVSEIVQRKIQQRQSANLEILKILKFLIERHKDLRFCQILNILELDRDKFYEESSDTLNSIVSKVEKMGG